jgi:hypothetical protein
VLQPPPRPHSLAAQSPDKALWRPKNTFKSKSVRRSVHRMEFREVPRRSMDREIPHWRYSDLCRVTLQCGTTGIGETLMYYTWGATAEEDVQRAHRQKCP